MKVLSTEGLTKLIQLIKSSFISTSNTVTTNTVTLADVATSGDFDDLTNKPTIPTAISGLTDDTSTYPIDKAKSVKDQRDSSSLKYWTGTKAQYDAISSYDTTTLYNIEGVGLYKGTTLIAGSLPNSANQDLSNLSQTGQAVIDGKVSKSDIWYDSSTSTLYIGVAQS